MRVTLKGINSITKKLAGRLCLAVERYFKLTL